MRSSRLLAFSCLCVLVCLMVSCGGGSSLGRSSGDPGGGTGGAILTDVVIADPAANNVDVLGISTTAIAPVAGTPITAGTQPSLVTVSPNLKFIYVANADSVSAFTIGTGGALTSLGSTSAGTIQSPSDLIVDSTGKFLIVGNRAAQSLSVFAITALTGALPATAVVKNVNVNPQSLAMSGNFLYVAGNNRIDGYVLNTTTGALTTMGGPFISSLFLNLSTLAAAPNGHFLYATDSAANQVYTFVLDPSTGIPSQQGVGVAAVLDPEAMRFNSAGNFLYVANKSGNSITLMSANTTTGVISTPTTVVNLTQPTAMAFDSVNNFLLALHGGNHLAVYSIAASGALTPVTGSPFTVGTAPTGIAIAKP